MPSKPNFHEFNFPYFPIIVLSIAFVLLILSISPYYQRQEPIFPAITKSLTQITPTIIPTSVVHEADSAVFCGGIAAIKCPKGYDCKLDGSHPDAGGKCLPSKTTPTPTTAKNSKYTCPDSEWVDCMPRVGGSPNPQCAKDFLNWATANCPNFKGAAL